MRESTAGWRLVYATADGELHEDRTLLAVGASGLCSIPLGRMIPLPEGSTLTQLPDCRPLGMNRRGEIVEHSDSNVRPASALLPTGFTRLLTPAYNKKPGADHLPLFGYTAIASRHGKLFASAVALDPGGAWDPGVHNTPDLHAIVQRRVDAEPHNRLLRHHARCATEYGCYTAQNLFYGTDEMAITVSGTCNAQCVGCISEQLDDITAPHDRIGFIPTVDEVVSLAVPHLRQAPRPIVSFGQGCEGEPLLRARLLGRSIVEMRTYTERGQVHINTNGSSARALQHLVDSGLDSVRVSMFSACERDHITYYGPKNYGLSDMEESLRLARRQGLHTSVNLLAYPGFTDCPEQVKALIDFFERTEVQVVQIRTLNMDRELLQERVAFPGEHGMGMAEFMDRIRQCVPGVTVASHTPYVGRARVTVPG